MAYPSDGWHPRWTPYRILVLTTTIGLGTAKAVATQNDGSVLPTTLEWISGVVLSIAFFVTSKYDSEESNSPYLSWIFKADCMDYLWDLRSRFGLRRPFYARMQGHHLENTAIPPITLYRIMVSFSVMFFGMSKAALSYFGHSISANWVDWLLGTFMSSIFYWFSLYENNSANLYPWFFVIDRSQYLYPTNKGILFTIFTALIGAWISVSVYGWMRMDAGTPQCSPSTLSAFETFYNRLIDFGLLLTFFMMILLGVAAFFLMTAIWTNNNFRVEGYGRRRIMARARSLMLSYLGRVFHPLLAYLRSTADHSKLLLFFVYLIFLIYVCDILVIIWIFRYHSGSLCTNV